MFDSTRARHRASLGHGLPRRALPPCARAAASCTVTLVAVALCTLAATGQVARAGQYHVYSCRTPDGKAAPTDGWTASTSPASATVVATDTCASGGALMAGLADGVEHEVGTMATWMFAVPASESIVGAAFWRAGNADGGSVANAYYEFWLAGPEDLDHPPYIFDECVASFSCPLGGVGDYQEVRSPKNFVTVPGENLGSNIYANTSCSGQTGFKCPEGRKDTNGYAAVVYLYAADVILEQAAQPSVTPGSVGGELATASKVSGTVSTTFEASDPGSGVYKAVVEVDEAPVGAIVLDSNGGRCADVGQASDGLPAFLYLKPCAPTVSADVPLDTASLADGLHRVVVRVTDAAGNSTVVIDRKLEVANAPASSGGSSSGGGSGSSSAGSSSSTATTSAGAGAPSAQPLAGTTLAGALGAASTSGASTGPANGSPATYQALLRVRWRSTAKSTLSSRWGRVQTIVGRLTTASGAPIAGASLEARATPAAQGATASAAGTVRTRADGSFGVRLSPHASSERVTVAYRAHLGDLVPAAVRSLSLRVPASLALRVTPGVSRVGGTIRFAGALRGGQIPTGGKQIVLQAHAPGSAWRTFQALSTDRRGRYRASYRFRLAGPIVYRFRVVSRQEADFPFATGASNVVSVWER